MTPADSPAKLKARPPAYCDRKTAPQGSVLFRRSVGAGSGEIGSVQSGNCSKQRQILPIPKAMLALLVRSPWPEPHGTSLGTQSGLVQPAKVSHRDRLSANACANRGFRYRHGCIEKNLTAGVSGGRFQERPSIQAHGNIVEMKIARPLLPQFRRRRCKVWANFRRCWFLLRWLSRSSESLLRTKAFVFQRKPRLLTVVWVLR